MKKILEDDQEQHKLNLDIDKLQRELDHTKEDTNSQIQQSQSR